MFMAFAGYVILIVGIVAVFQTTAEHNERSYPEILKED